MNEEQNSLEIVEVPEELKDFLKGVTNKSLIPELIKDSNTDTVTVNVPTEFEYNV